MTGWKNKEACAGLLALALAAAWQPAPAAPLRDRIAEMRGQQGRVEPMEDREIAPVAVLPQGTRVRRDIPYGKDDRQRFDVYAPARAAAAPVLFMVHGGAWAFGDKMARAVVENKVARWVPRGFVVVSANYRLLPQADPLTQARDVARALAVAQDRAGEWGGDRNRFVLMGHSAGAHLVALLSASSTLAEEAGAKPWLGTVLLDTAALDLVQIMEIPHRGLYDLAFGADPSYWKAVSPFHALVKTGPPILAVCSTQRSDACPQARRFAGKALALGRGASVLEQDLSHSQINDELGAESPYTDAVDSFLGSLLRGTPAK